MHPAVDVVFHGRCPDGAVAAWMLSRALDGPVRLLPYLHGGPLPEPASDEVWVLDVAFSAETLQAWADRCSRVFVLDHHQTSAAMLAGRIDPLAVTLAHAVDPAFRGVGVSIAMEHSGAGLAAAAACALDPATTVPDFVFDIEDRDLWRWGRAQSREVCAAIDAVADVDALAPEALFAVFDGLADLEREELAAQGAPIIAAFDHRVDELCHAVRLVDIAGSTVPVVEVPEARFGSEVGHRLLELHPDAPFSGYWYHAAEGAGLRVGLRSDDGRADVEQVAARFGGGGHRNASGLMCVSLADLATPPDRPRR